MYTVNFLEVQMQETSSRHGYLTPRLMLASENQEHRYQFPHHGSLRVCLNIRHPSSLSFEMSHAFGEMGIGEEGTCGQGQLDGL